MRPTIGITSARERSDAITGTDEAERHAQLLEKHAARSVILPRFTATGETLSRYNLKGILFSGGGDVSPSLYGGRPELGNDRVDPVRDSGELFLLRRAVAARIPLLCVCRGMQLANVAFGGTLIEDIRSEDRPERYVAHHQVRDLARPIEEPTHEVSILPGSLLAGILGRRVVSTNSLHHQAIRSLATRLTGVGYTSDGLIEAIELKSPDFFFLGVQWHPESLPDDDASSQIYAAFVDASSTSQNRSGETYEIH